MDLNFLAVGVFIVIVLILYALSRRARKGGSVHRNTSDGSDFSAFGSGHHGTGHHYGGGHHSSDSGGGHHGGDSAYFQH